jgi:lysophospholipase L1-like esterase
MRRRGAAFVLTAICLAWAAAGPANAQSDDPSAPTVDDGSGLSLVGLGDSLPGQIGGYVEMLADAVSERLGVPVAVTNLATNDGVGSDGVLGRVRSSPAYRDAIAGADIITIQVGRNDWFETCYAPNLVPCLTAGEQSVEANLDAILTEIEGLRAGQPTAVRVLDYYNAETGDPALALSWDFEDTPEATTAFLESYLPLFESFDAMICRVAEAHDAVCIDILPGFNGADGRGDAAPYLQADHTHPNAAGAELMTRLIAEAGFAPLG